MSEGVWIAIIGCIGVISTAMSGVVIAILHRQTKTVGKVRDHVENSHIGLDGKPYNLRDNIDDNQAAVLSEFRGIRRDLGRIDGRVIALEVGRHEDRRALETHLDWSRGQEDRIDGLEDTLNVRKES